MNVQMKRLDEIRPYKNNPRKNDQAVDAVAESIREFGFRQPIVIDKNGVIIAGHTRYKAAKSLGLTEVPCEIASDLTDEQAKAYRLADNKSGELASMLLSIGTTFVAELIVLIVTSVAISGLKRVGK